MSGGGAGGGGVKRSLTSCHFAFCAYPAEKDVMLMRRGHPNGRMIIWRLRVHKYRDIVLKPILNISEKFQNALMILPFYSFVRHFFKFHAG
jgi:hypothetical protein